MQNFLWKIWIWYLKYLTPIPFFWSCLKLKFYDCHCSIFEIISYLFLSFFRSLVMPLLKIFWNTILLIWSSLTLTFTNIGKAFLCYEYVPICFHFILAMNIQLFYFASKRGEIFDSDLRINFSEHFGFYVLLLCRTFECTFQLANRS